VDTSQHPSKLKEYLLGRLSEAERQAMERRCFADDEFFLDVEAAEQDLIDSYVRGSLPPGERVRFEKAFLASPARARRVEIARHLIGYIDEKRPANQTPQWSKFFVRLQGSLVFKPTVIAAATCLFIIAAATVFWTERRSPAPKLAQVQGPSEQPKEITSAPDERPRTPERTTVIPAFLLTPGLSRGVGSLQIVRPGEASSIRLQLMLESVDYTRYEASIETPDGEVVFSQSDLGPSSVNKSQVVVLNAPVSKLVPGDYIVRLLGVEAGSKESVADYSFRAARN
jgi:anti-sigma factor RsiW